MISYQIIIFMKCIVVNNRYVVVIVRHCSVLRLIGSR